ncbi:hypothetical protein IQ247_04485 [Plectonema cf. radiosum LEGE 06105]|uniref:Uncharacterized protein n=1 Tax=Plectonema cf. radiosum LEGE 06105 TaxID=945769 RepID=A0A8J7JZ38_9CYAN|nr:hypothetical protein [Plectonema radiosum]MBE9211981.1 hypothetical protein [Plectonema cf. radiosum LEGE 06105]
MFQRFLKRDFIGAFCGQRWQQVVNNASTVVSSVTSAVKIGVQEFKNNSKQHQFAALIKNLFQLQTQPGENHYQAGDYQISRSGLLYEVKDSATDKFLIQFRETPLGVKVEKGDLASLNIQDINSLQNSLRKKEPVPASFAPVGKQEAEYFARVERVTNALTQYAVAQQTDVEIDGRFSYKWKASPNGNVQIEAKDGRGSLLEKTGGQLTSNMNERDLIYFEQILPKLQPRNQGRRQEADGRSESVKYVMTIHQFIEEPDDAKVSSPVLKPSANSDVCT